MKAFFTFLNNHFLRVNGQRGDASGERSRHHDSYHSSLHVGDGRVFSST